jgi:DNA repair exonuclease SbcCD ATPase subunit
LLIDYLRLTDVCQHRELEVAFRPGVNGVIGANGSGKTNLIRALQFALTGVWPAAKERSRRVRRGAEKGSVELELQVRGKPMKIVRSVESSRCSLEFGGETLRSASAVNAKLSELLAVTPKLLQTYVFVSQGETTQVLNATPAARAELLQNLFGTEKCDRIRRLLADEVGRLTALLPAEDEPAEVVQDRLNAMLANIGGLRSEIDSRARALQGCDPAALAAQVADGEMKSRQVLDPSNGLAATQRAITAVTAEVDRVTLTGKQAADEVDRLQKEGAALSDKVAEAKAAVQHGEQTRRLVQQRAQLTAQADALSAEAAGKSPPASIDDKGDWVPEANQKVAQLLTLVETAKSFAANFKKHGACPTCGTTKIVGANGVEVDIAARLREFEESTRLAAPELEQLTTRIESYRSTVEKAKLDRASHDAWLVGWNQRVEQVFKSLETLPDVQVVDTTAAAQLLGVFQQNQAALSEARAKLEKLRADYPGHVARLRSLETRLADLNKLLPLPDVSAIRSQLEQHQRATGELNQMRGQLQQMESTAAMIKEQLDRLLVRRARAANVKSFLSLVEGARESLHPDAYPAEVARIYLQQLNQGWGQMLSVLDVKFAAEINATLDVVLKYPGGDFFVEEASGGEACCASLSFLMAVNRMFASQVGLIVLDEPTYGVDSDHIDRVAELFRQAQNYTDSTGTQILVVTHEDRLRGAFNHVVQLESVR